MKKGILIWVTALVVAFTMSFTTVLSFADEPLDAPDVSAGEQISDELSGGAPDAGVPEEDVTQTDEDAVLKAMGTEGDGSGTEPGSDPGSDPADPEPKDLGTECDVTWAKTVNFNGSAAKPAVTVKIIETGETVPAANYTVTWSNNTAATKSAKVTVTANADSTLIKGTKSGTFVIVYPMTKYGKITLSKSSLPVKFKKNEDWKVIPVVQKPTVKVTGYNGKVLKNGTDYTFKYANAKSKNAGTYKVTVTAKSGSDYVGTITTTYKITPMKLNNDYFEVRADDRHYTGKTLKPRNVFINYYNDKTGLDMDLVKGTHYTVVKAVKATNNKKIGRANLKITIKGKGNFTGTKVITGVFWIGPGKATIKSVKAGKKKVTIKWKRCKRADGYIIDFYGWKGSKDTSKTVYVKSGKTVSKTVKGLKSGYTYDIWVSAYKNVKGEKIYIWEKPKTVKVK